MESEIQSTEDILVPELSLEMLDESTKNNVVEADRHATSALEPPFEQTNPPSEDIGGGSKTQV